MDNNKKRVVAVGDVHGCLEELQDLLKLLEYHPDKDRVVLLGDLIDRGPDSPGVVRFAREHKFEAVKGNHDEKAPRWARHQAKEKLTGKANPMKNPGPKRVAEWEALTEDELKWLDELPWTIQLAPGWVGVHAGFEPSQPMPEQAGDRMCRVRYVDQVSGLMVPTRLGETPPVTACEWTRYPGEWKIRCSAVYGHIVHDLKVPRIDQNTLGDTFYAIDTGGCFGGCLTAWLYTPGDPPRVTTASVPARGVYADLRGSAKDD